MRPQFLEALGKGQSNVSSILRAADVTFGLKYAPQEMERVWPGWLHFWLTYENAFRTIAEKCTTSQALLLEDDAAFSHRDFLARLACWPAEKYDLVFLDGRVLRDYWTRRYENIIQTAGTLVSCAAAKKLVAALRPGSPERTAYENLKRPKHIHISDFLGWACDTEIYRCGVTSLVAELGDFASHSLLVMEP